MREDFDKVVSTLKNLSGRKVLILTHHNADVDAVASAIALSEGLKQKGVNVQASAAESISKPAQQIAKKYNFLIDPDCAKFNYVILVETSVPEQLASVKNLKGDMVIDHHPAGRLAEGAVCYIDENAKSTAQIIYKILKELGCSIDKETAKIIAAGIIADTAHLRLADREVFLIMSELLEWIEFSDALKLIETPQDVSERVAALKAAMRSELYKFGDVLVAVSSVASHEAAAARALMKIGADIAVVIAEKESEMRISSRGRESILKHTLDLSELFKDVGKFLEGSGGGHSLAGSANGKRKPAQQVKKFILELLTKKLGSWKFVS